VFVALPALAGLFFENGGAIMTDALLLALGCLFLYWSVKWPWQWYRCAQAKVFIDFDPNNCLQDDDNVLVDQSPTRATDADDAEGKEIDPVVSSVPVLLPRARREQNSKQLAGESLQRYELVALASCFLLPIAVACLMHGIRPYLSRPSGGLVSNSNLTLFVLAAEVRPFLHIFKLIEARTWHLQTVVMDLERNDDPQSPVQLSQVPEIIGRLQLLEGQLVEWTTSINKGKHPEKVSAENAESIVATAMQSIQPQLDALNRAVRRYEKRATMQSVIMDSRLRDLDTRVNDALSLAAAASRLGHHPGILTRGFEAMNSTVSSFAHAVYSLSILPWKLWTRMTVFLLSPRQKPKTRTKREDRGRKTL
jgi:hypothetical protein